MAKAILLAEDSSDDIALFMQVMVKSGRSNPVIVVRDGDEVIAYLKGEGEFADREKFPMPAILMLDLKMPRTSGFQVLEWVRQQPQFNDLLLVVLSHYGETAEITRAYGLGAHSFLTKPFSHADLDNLASHYHTWWENDVLSH